MMEPESFADERDALIDQIDRLTFDEFKWLVVRVITSASARGKLDLSHRMGFVEYLDAHERLWPKAVKCLAALNQKSSDISQIADEPQTSKIKPNLASRKGSAQKKASRKKRKPSTKRQARGKPNKLKFLNRERELAKLRDENGSSYWMINAPAGYGKTEFLKKLAEYYENDDWFCARVAIQKSTTIHELATEIGKQLFKRSVRFDVQFTPDRLGRELAEIIQRKLFDESKTSKSAHRRGLVLLFDLDRPPLVTASRPSVDLEALILDFAREIKSVLNRLVVFKFGRCRFRVVVAGRHLDQWWKSRMGTIDLHPLALTPFKFQNVFDSVDQYWPTRLRSENGQLATHLMFFTGGHPGCLVDVLELYREAGAPDVEDFFVRRVTDFGWQPSVQTTIDTIYREIPEELRGILDVVSVFRVLDYRLLKSLFSDSMQLLNGVPSEHLEELRANLPSSPLFLWNGTDADLARTLVHTQLLNWDKSWLYLMSDIVRRLLVLRWLERDRTGFVRLTGHARAMCEALVLHSCNDEGRAIKWFMEMLFQTLQGSILIISNEQERKLLRERFFNTELPHYLSILTEVCDPERIKIMLVPILEENEDWELEFVMNFFLRGKSYTDEPYRSFLTAVRQYFQG